MVIVAVLVGLVLTTADAAEHWSFPQAGAEGWIIPMPLGDELDVQRNRSGSLRVYWQTP